MRAACRLAVTMALVLGALLVAPGAVWAQPQPGGTVTLELVTVPPVPEARFEIDGKELVTDGAGVARGAVATGTERRTLRMVNPYIARPGQVAEFVRWWGGSVRDEGFSSTISDLRVRRNLRIQVGFRISYEVNFDFADQARDPVEPERISGISIRNDAGQTETVTGAQVMLTGVRPVLERSRLIARSAAYSVQSIEIDGSNAVTAGEQRFAPDQEQAVTLTVPMRSVRLRAYDVLFASPSGRAIEMTYPDGRRISVPLDANGEAAVDGLVRGAYTMRVDGPGYAPPQSVELSRSQTVALPVLSYADMATLAASAVLVLGGLLLARRHRRRVMERGEEPG